MADNDPDTSIQQFIALTGASAEQARQYLEPHSWDVPAACNSYFEDLDDVSEGQQAESAPADEAVPDNYTGPRTLDGRPAPHAATSSRAATKRAAPKRKGVATLASLAGQDDDDDDDDDEDDDPHSRGNLFAGGEKSGLAVQDPSRDGGPRKLIDDIVAKAKANSQRPDGEDENPGPSRASRFTGTGMTLGGEGVESREIPDPRGPAAAIQRGEPQERVLHIWQDGFSIDDGELRRFDDPANQADLAMIQSGRAPLHLMNVQHGQAVDVKLFQHQTPYTPQPKKYKPFSGSGRRLGSPVPGDGEGSAAESSSLDAVVSSSTPAAQSSTPEGHSIDDSQPTITLRLQLPNGTRLPARFNTTHTVGDVYNFIQSASAETRTRSWVLATTFPNKEHKDKDQVLGEMSEFKKGGTAVVKWT